MNNTYYAVIQKDTDSDYGVIFPDFLGCISAGTTLTETYEMAQEALEFHIEGMLEDKEIIPKPLSRDVIEHMYHHQYVEIKPFRINTFETV